MYCATRWRQRGAVRFVHFTQPVVDRQIQFRVALLLVALRLELLLVRLELLAEVLAVKRPLELVRVEVTRVLAQRAIEIRVVDRLDDHVQALQLVVDVEATEGLARCRLAHAREEGHRDALVHHRPVLPEVLEHDRLQPEKLLTGDVAVEVDPQAEFGRVAACVAARTHAGAAHAEVAPLQVGRVVRVLLEVGAQVPQVPRVDGQAELLDRVGGEQVILRLRARRRGSGQGDAQARGRDEERTSGDLESCHGVTHIENWNRTMRLQ